MAASPVVLLPHLWVDLIEHGRGEGACNVGGEKGSVSVSVSVSVRGSDKDRHGHVYTHIPLTQKIPSQIERLEDA